MTRDATQITKFVREGYSTYPDAFEAVDLFETEVHRTIAKVFDEKTPSLRGVQRRKGNGDVPAPIQKNPRSGRAISAWIPCEPVGDEANVAVALGLIWNAPKFRAAPVVAYAHYWVGRTTRPVALPADVDSRLKYGPLEKNDHRFYIVVDEGFELEEGVALLLDAIDAGIAASTTTESR